MLNILQNVQKRGKMTGRRKAQLVPMEMIGPLKEASKLKDQHMSHGVGCTLDEFNTTFKVVFFILVFLSFCPGEAHRALSTE